MDEKRAFKGAYFTIQKALPLLRQGSSVIINASVGARKGWPITSTVSTCKAAVVHLARILSAELVDRGIRVNTLSPGPTDTAMFGRFPGEEQGEAVTTPLLPLPPHLHLDAARRGGEASLRLSPDGTSLEMIQKHYGDARVDADQLDEMIGEFESATGNLPGTLPDASDDSVPSKVMEPFVFYGVPTRAGDRGRTGDVQLGKLAFYH